MQHLRSRSWAETDASHVSLVSQVYWRFDQGNQSAISFNCDFSSSFQGLSTAIVLCVLAMHGVSSRDVAIPSMSIRILFAVL